MTVRFNNSCCLNGSRRILGPCVCPNEYYIDKRYEIRDNALTLPMIGAIFHDIPSLRHIYFFIFILLASIGLINNIFSLMTFIRERIRFTVCGVYLIMYSICCLILMILILSNVIIAIRYDDYLFRLWACRGYPYLSLVMFYTSILITAAIAVEGVLNNCLDFDKYRPRKRALLISFLLLIIVLISNLDKIFARHLITDQSGSFYCTYKNDSHQFWLRMNTIRFYIYIIISCLIHIICIILILSMRIKETFFQRIFICRNYLIPSLFIILCLVFNGLYRYLFQFCLTYSSRYMIRFHIAFLYLIYAPQIFTYLIYIIPNLFYIKEFYQIWFYRKLCCCFYNKGRHIQEFEVINKLWQRRTSLETVKTISNLDDTCMESEFYEKVKMES